MGGEEHTMSKCESETITDKKLFDRLKENFKEFFIEDDKKEEKESLIDPNGGARKMEPTEEYLEERNMSQNMLNANGKEDLEGIPEEEEEIIREETLEPAKDVGENALDENKNIEDCQDDSDTGNVVDTNTNSLLIQETVHDEEDDRQQSKAPFFKVLANFSFLKKKSPKDPTASQEQDPLDDSTNIIDKNGLPSYDEVIDQQAEKT